ECGFPPAQGWTAGSTACCRSSASPSLHHRKASAARVGSISAQSALHLWFYAHVLRCGAGSVGIAGINYHYVGKPTDDSSLQGLPRQHHRPRLCLQASVTESPIALPPGKGSVPCRNHTSYLLPSHRCRVTSRRFLASTAKRRRI